MGEDGVEKPPIEIRRAERQVLGFNKEAENRLRLRSLEFWDREKPHDVFTLSNAILRINTKAQRDDFSTGVAYLQEEIKLVASKKISRKEKEFELFHYISTHDRSFLLGVFRKVLNPSGKLAKDNLNINDLAFCIAQHEIDSNVERGKSPVDVGFTGASLQRVLSYSFLHLSPQEMVDNVQSLTATSGLFVKLLKEPPTKSLENMVFTMVLGAASSTLAMLSAQEYVGADDVSPAPDYIDFYNGVDGFMWSRGKIIGCMQSGTTRIGTSVSTSLFGDGKGFRTSMLPFAVVDEDEVETRSLTEPKKAAGFLRGSKLLARQGILPWGAPALLYLSDFRGVSQAVYGGQYSLNSFVRDVGEHIGAIKQGVSRRQNVAIA